MLLWKCRDLLALLPNIISLPGPSMYLINERGHSCHNNVCDLFTIATLPVVAIIIIYDTMSFDQVSWKQMDQKLQASMNVYLQKMIRCKKQLINLIYRQTV